MQVPRVVRCLIGTSNDSFRMNTPTYFLAQTAFICPTRRHWVVLDIRNDCYLSVDRLEFESLRPWLHGACAENEAAAADVVSMPPCAAKLATNLVARGILSERSDIGKPVTPVESSVPNSAIESQTGHTNIRLRLASVPAFFWASTRADYRLRRQSLHTLVTDLQRRNARMRSANKTFNWDVATRLTQRFQSLRLIYPRPYLCIYDSLALLEFFALHSLFPTWVFGVTVDPFRAHCWLQQGDVVIGDAIERVRSYRPIMYV